MTLKDGPVPVLDIDWKIDSERIVRYCSHALLLHEICNEKTEPLRQKIPTFCFLQLLLHGFDIIFETVSIRFRSLGSKQTNMRLFPINF